MTYLCWKYIIEIAIRIIPNIVILCELLLFVNKPGLELHISSSQKHIWPFPELSIMHTWSTINKFICNCDVHILRTTSYAEIINCKSLVFLGTLHKRRLTWERDLVLWHENRGWQTSIMNSWLRKTFIFLHTWFRMSNHFYTTSVACHQWWLVSR